MNNTESVPATEHIIENELHMKLQKEFINCI
jgi:hypothetical protein